MVYLLYMNRNTLYTAAKRVMLDFKWTVSVRRFRMYCGRNSRARDKLDRIWKVCFDVSKAVDLGNSVTRSFFGCPTSAGRWEGRKTIFLVWDLTWSSLLKMACEVIVLRISLFTSVDCRWQKKNCVSGQGRAIKNENDAVICSLIHFI